MSNGGQRAADLTEAWYKSGHALHICGVDTLGAPILIYECAGRINHVDSSDHGNPKSSIPRVEICAHGIRVGCTFITVDAVRRLAREMEDFKRCHTKVIQP